MLRIFRHEILDPDNFVITVELVPGRESRGRTLDTVIGIAADAFSDGRVCALSITDNPGGNPTLGSAFIGYEILKIGLDVIVHVAGRDLNRLGLESRCLQLASMGIKNILALTGDFVGTGFAGQGGPVFDLDSVTMLAMQRMLTERMDASGDPEGFFSGCAVSPFKYTEGECRLQYIKLWKKITAGASYVITQLGYDAEKFRELIRIKTLLGLEQAMIGSVYVLTPGAAKAMNQGKIPGVVVTDSLLQTVSEEWRDKKTGRKACIERAAQLCAVLKGLGYNGAHIGGIHKSFDLVGDILDRFEKIQDQWRRFMPQLDFSPKRGFYAFSGEGRGDKPVWDDEKPPRRLPFLEKIHFDLMRTTHRYFFDFQSPLAPLLKKMAQTLDRTRGGRLLTHIVEDPLKIMLLRCERCGDCAIQHVGFLCPQSGCPKNTRNGPCGGSHNGMCEVHPDRYCVWFRAFKRFASVGKTSEMLALQGCVPPRMWELDRTPSWLNFHLGRDHQSSHSDFGQYCQTQCTSIILTEQQ